MSREPRQSWSAARVQRPLLLGCPSGPYGAAMVDAKLTRPWRLEPLVAPFVLTGLWLSTLSFGNPAAAYNDRVAGGLTTAAAALLLTVPTGFARSLRTEIGLRLPNPRVRWLAAAPAATAALVWAVGRLVATLRSTGAGPADPRREWASAAGWAGGLLLVWVSGAVSEELLFRGALLLIVARSVTIRRRPALGRLALVVSSVLFGLAHLPYGVGNVVTATVDGLAYGTLALRSRSLWPAVLAHGAYDSIWVASVLLHH